MNNDNSNVLSKNLIDFCINPSDFVKLNQLDAIECRQILPFLTRICVRGDIQPEYSHFKLAILDKLSLFEDTNKIRGYLNADFDQIYEDVIKHLSARKKSQTLSTYTYVEFESASPTSKLLMIANILLNGNIRVVLFKLIFSDTISHL